MLCAMSRRLLRPHSPIALAFALIASTAACKDPPPRSDAKQGAKGAAAPGDTATRSRARTPQDACGASPLAGLPLFDRPLDGEIEGGPLPIESAEVVRGGLALVTDAGRIVIPVAGAGRREIRLLATPDRLAGIDRIPNVRGSLRVGDQPVSVAARGIRLDLSPMQGGRAPGMVTLCLTQPQGVLAGRFEARADEDISDSPDPSRDHASTLRFVVDRTLEGQGIDLAAIRHRGTWIDPARGVGYDHVVAVPAKDTPAPPWSSRSFLLHKKDGRWAVLRETDGRAIPEAAQGVPGDENAPWIQAAAAAVQDALDRTKMTGYASRVRMDGPVQHEGDVEKATITVMIRPDRKNGKLGAPRRYRVEAERRDGGVRVTRVARIDRDADRPSGPRKQAAADSRPDGPRPGRHRKRKQ